MAFNPNINKPLYHTSRTITRNLANKIYDGLNEHHKYLLSIFHNLTIEDFCDYLPIESSLYLINNYAFFSISNNTFPLYSGDLLELFIAFENNDFENFHSCDIDKEKSKYIYLRLKDFDLFTQLNKSLEQKNTTKTIRKI